MDANPIGHPEASAGRFRLAAPRTVLVLAGLVLGLLVGWVALTVLTGALQVSDDGVVALIALVFTAVGVVVARRQPGNRVGWMLIGVACLALFNQDANLYAVFAYRVHQGGLPLGRLAAYWFASFGLSPFLFGLPVVLLFPDGRVPSLRWRWLLRAYVVLSVLLIAAQCAAEAGLFSHRVRLDATGNVFGAGHPTGLAKAVADASWVAPALPLLWLSFVGHQIGAWRRAHGEQREQLKWLMSGAALCALAPLVIVFTANASSLTAHLARDMAALAIAALPVSIGVGILKYRLYEIDRLISRTLSYLIITGLLAGVFVGIVVLATDVLPFSSPVAVAASTLAAAALFNPLRLRVQHQVDRRFNRSRYDAEAVVAAFALRLREVVDLDTVRSDLLQAVGGAVQPGHASLWLRPPAQHPNA